MALNLESNQAEIRETRLGGITAYHGTAAGLCSKVKSGKACDTDRSFSQGVSCSSINAICQVVLIQDAVVINHAPIGCAGDLAQFNFINKSGQRKRAFKQANIRVINTNLEEKDTVYGGTGKLEEAIREAYKRYTPKAIFITTSCASGIIGDDIQGSADSVQEEIGIPVIPVFCEGFKSKIWASGFDAAYHALVTRVVKPPKKKTNKINVINFWGSDIFTEIFERLGLEPNYIVPFTSIEQIEELSEAAATVQICATLGTYLAAALEEKYGVTEVKSPPPYGLAAADIWFRELGRVTGKEKEVEEYIAEERARVIPQIAEYKEKLKGKKAFVVAGGIYGHSIMYILKELGIEVAGGAIFHHDQKFDNQDEKTDSLEHLVNNYGDVDNFSISHKQSYELVNILNRIKPDIFIVRHPGMSIWGAKLGIPTFLMGDEQFGFGYQGILNYAEKIADTISNPAYVKNLAKHTKLPYTKWWLEQDPHYFVNKESEVEESV